MKGIRHLSSLVRDARTAADCGIRWPVWLAILALALVARGGPQFPGSPIVRGALIGNDAYYHALRAERALATWPRVPVEDPAIAYPEGARILWPPLLDALTAGAARAFDRAANRDTIRRVGAWIPVAAGVASVALVCLLGTSLLGPGVGAAAGALTAVFPAHVEFTRAGYLDHHALEVMALLLVLLGLHWCARAAPGWRGVVLLGAGIGVAFLGWPGGVLHAGLAASIAGGAWLLGSAGNATTNRLAARIAAGLALGAAVMVGGILMFSGAAELRRFELGGANGFHVAFVGCAALSALALAWVDRQGLRPRALAALVAAALPLVAASLLLPGFGAVIASGLEWARGGSGFYGNIVENDPLLLSGLTPFTTEVRTATMLLGLGLPLAPFALWRLWRGFPDDAAGGVRALLAVTAFFLVLALTRQRFMVYLAPMLALALAASGRAWIRALGQRFAGAWQRSVAVIGTVLVLSPCVPWYVANARGGQPAGPDPVNAALTWLGARAPVDPDRPAVFAEWDYGHKIQYLARKPVLVSPFGTDVGRAAMLDFARAFVAQDPGQFEAIAASRRIGFVFLANPVTEAIFAPLHLGTQGGALVRLDRDWRRGASVTVLPPFWGTVVSRLYFGDGTVPRGYDGEALAHWRLVYESDERESWQGYAGARFKLFEWVPGVRLDVSGVAPGARVTVRVQRSRGREARPPWFSTVLADTAGRASLVVPYATGANGTVAADAAMLDAGGATLPLSITEREVRLGSVRSVALPRHGPP